MPSQASDFLAHLTAWLVAHEVARVALEVSAPKACQCLGGAEAIMDRCGGQMVPHAGGWWAVNLDDETWSALAAEQQAPYRSGGGGMSLQPLDPEVFSRIKADHRARRGPFAHTVVAIHELVCHYDVRNLRRTQAKWALREVCAREALCKGDATIRLFVAHAGPLVEAEAPSVLAEYRRERGLPET